MSRVIKIVAAIAAAAALTVAVAMTAQAASTTEYVVLAGSSAGAEY